MHGIIPYLSVFRNQFHFISSGGGDIYYGNIFMCDNEEVDNALQKLYGNPNIGRMPVGFDSFSEGVTCLCHMGITQEKFYDFLGHLHSKLFWSNLLLCVC